MGQLAEFASNHPFHVLSVAIALVAVLFYEIRLQGRGQTQVSTADAVRLINKGAIVVDIRKPEEFSAGHIVNARNIEPGALESDQSLAKKRKTKPVLVVCDNGTKAGRAVSALRKAGFEQVFSLRAGLSSWRGDNLPLVK